MKHFFFASCIFLGTLVSAMRPAENLTVTSVESERVTGITIITYSLSGTALMYDVAVEVSFDDGISYTLISSAHLSGDVEAVTPGADKRITWDGGAGFPNTYSTETKVRLTAQVSITSLCGASSVTFTYNGSEVTYGIVVGANGKCWLDRNLGASQVATSSTDELAYGDLFQWGRGDDGHQVRISPVYNTGLASTPLTYQGNDWDGKFIGNSINHPLDWLTAQNDDLWQGENGVNNPCPAGYRLPTEAEFTAERLSWSSNNSTGAFASPLKLSVAGFRYLNGSSFGFVGSYGSYWSSTVIRMEDNMLLSRYLFFDDSHDAGEYFEYRAAGYSVRCIKDYERAEVE